MIIENQNDIQTYTNNKASFRNFEQSSRSKIADLTQKKSVSSHDFIVSLLLQQILLVGRSKSPLKRGLLKYLRCIKLSSGLVFHVRTTAKTFSISGFMSSSIFVALVLSGLYSKFLTVSAHFFSWFYMLPDRITSPFIRLMNVHFESRNWPKKQKLGCFSENFR